MNFLIKSPITNSQQAKLYIDFIETQYIYHPDDCATSVTTPDGNRVYNDEEASMINQRNSEIFDHIHSPYEYILDVREFKNQLK